MNQHPVTMTNLLNLTHTTPNYSARRLLAKAVAAGEINAFQPILSVIQPLVSHA
jgi:hypothetical protein